MSERFARERVMHELKRRQLSVVRTQRVAPALVRITLGGADLEGFVAPGPADHIKVFFPAADGETVARDYTPFAFRPDAEGGPELDVDFVLHGDNGPASAWAARAEAGHEISIGGPRGSRLAPSDAARVILVADESALPAAARWIDAFPGLPVIGLFTVADEATAEYLADRDGADRDYRWFTGDDRDARLAEALRELCADESATGETFFALAGEATALIPLRRYLRRELGLSKDQVDAQGYWKRGIIALDHHAPLDPDDAD